jgi:hypothetical protein
MLIMEIFVNEGFHHKSETAAFPGPRRLDLMASVSATLAGGFSDPPYRPKTLLTPSNIINIK